MNRFPENVNVETNKAKIRKSNGFFFFQVRGRKAKLNVEA